MLPGDLHRAGFEHYLLARSERVVHGVERGAQHLDLQIVHADAERPQRVFPDFEERFARQGHVAGPAREFRVVLQPAFAVEPHLCPVGQGELPDMSLGSQQRDLLFGCERLRGGEIASEEYQHDGGGHACIAQDAAWKRADPACAERCPEPFESPAVLLLRGGRRMVFPDVPQDFVDPGVVLPGQHPAFELLPDVFRGVRMAEYVVDDSLAFRFAHRVPVLEGLRFIALSASGCRFPNRSRPRRRPGRCAVRPCRWPRS